MLAIVDGEEDTLIDEFIDVVGPCALGCTSGENLVFLTGSGDPGLMVIDGDRDCQVRVLSSGYEPQFACVEPCTGKALFLSHVPPGLVVVDGHTGQFTTFIPTGHEPYDLCCDTVNHIVYAAGGMDCAAITAVDASGDGVVNTVRIDGWECEDTRVCVDSRDRKVYVAGSVDSLAVFNWSCESLLGVVSVGRRIRALVYHEPGHRVYCGTDYGVVEVDCATDEVTRRIQLGCPVSTLCLGSAGDRLYCIGGDYLVTIDCRTASVVDSVSVGHDMCALCYNPADDKVYCGGWADSVSVHAGSDGHLLATIATGPIDWSWSFAYDSCSNTVLCASADHHSITFIDGQSNRVPATLACGIWPYSVATAAGIPFAFACGRSEIAVIRKDSTVAEFGVAAVPGRTSGSLVRGRLFSTDKPGSVLVNAAGRKVLDLHPGMNDVGRLPAGIYFVREAPAHAQAQAVRKVIVTR